MTQKKIATQENWDFKNMAIFFEVQSVNHTKKPQSKWTVYELHYKLIGKIWLDKKALKMPENWGSAIRFIKIIEEAVPTVYQEHRTNNSTYFITSSICNICKIGTKMVKKGTKTLNDDLTYMNYL